MFDDTLISDISTDYSVDIFYRERAFEDCLYYDPEQRTGMEKYCAVRGICANIYPSYDINDVLWREGLSPDNIDHILESYDRAEKGNFEGLTGYERTKLHKEVLNIHKKIRSIESRFVLSTKYKYQVSFRMINNSWSENLGFNEYQEIKDFVALIVDFHSQKPVKQLCFGFRGGL
jgi:hypothetical protein